jgi:hypothetical protein
MINQLQRQEKIIRKPLKYETFLRGRVKCFKQVLLLSWVEIETRKITKKIFEQG